MRAWRAHFRFCMGMVAESGVVVEIDSEVLLKHSLVPEHKILKKKEAEKLLGELGLTKDHLPKILENDPVVRAIGACRGNVLRITRQSPTAGEAIYYRLVV